MHYKNRSWHAKCQPHVKYFFAIFCLYSSPLWLSCGKKIYYLTVDWPTNCQYNKRTARSLLMCCVALPYLVCCSEIFQACSPIMFPRLSSTLTLPVLINCWMNSMIFLYKTNSWPYFPFFLVTVLESSCSDWKKRVLIPLLSFFGVCFGYLFLGAWTWLCGMAIFCICMQWLEFSCCSSENKAIVLFCSALSCSSSLCQRLSGFANTSS